MSKLLPKLYSSMIWASNLIVQFPVPLADKLRFKVAFRPVVGGSVSAQHGFDGF
ncbi:MAG: hypothetical protein R2788_13705 [Saprospiraceae bacterium]